MTDLNTTILQKASGENRLNPDEQRQYMGTFRERVVLVLSFEQAVSSQLEKQFEALAKQLIMDYQPLFLKLSPKLSDSLQIHYMKIGQQLGITVSIIDEKIADSPYAMVFHTDRALNKESIQLEECFPHFVTQAPKKEETKPSFWKKLFG